MATIQIGARPLSLDGCFSTWNQHDMPSVIRSDMDLAGYTKVRRRTTVAGSQVEASVMLKSDLYEDFMAWFRLDCAAGVLPTRVKRPDGTEVVMRFTAPPVIEYPERDKTVFRASVTLEQLPQWIGL